MDIAYAVGEATGAAGGGGGGLLSLSNPMWMLFAMFAVMYFLLIRPQQKNKKSIGKC